MGRLEKISKERSRRKYLKKYILSAVSAAGVLAVGLLAPNVIGAISKLGLLPSSRQKEAIKTSRDRLIKSGLLAYSKNLLSLTRKGKAVLLSLELKDFKIERPSKWDGKWRVLVFDIPEKRKGLRERIRTTLVAIGFARLQDSVWIYPYDCEDFVTLLKVDFKIGRDVLYMIVEMLEYDAPIKKLFGLKG